MGPVTRVIGRESELTLIREFVDADAPRRAIVLTGRAGIGKTTLWEAAIELARERGWRVLAARGSGAEAQLPFSALIDLSDDVVTNDLAGLAGPQRTALEVALLRAEPAEEPPSAQAIALGFRNLLRTLSARAPLLIMIDDVQWLDEPSLEVLTFLARRLREQRVAFLLTRRAEEPSAIERALDRGDVQSVEIPPLSFGAIRRLLIDRLGLRVSRQLLRRIIDITLANPLFALELGRELLASGVPADAEELPVPAGIEDLLGTRVASLAPSARRVLLALALSADLRVGELVAVASQEAVDEAVDWRARPRRWLPRACRASAASGCRAAERGPRRAPRVAHLARGRDVRSRAAGDASGTRRGGSRRHAVCDRGRSVGRGLGARSSATGGHAGRARASVDAGRLGASSSARAQLGGVSRDSRRDAPLGGPADARGGGASARRAAGPRACLMLAESAGSQHMDDLAALRQRALAEGADDPGLQARGLAKQASNAAASTISDMRRAEESALAAVRAAASAGPGHSAHRPVRPVLGTGDERALSRRPVRRLEGGVG